jgi:hypothetical protein
LGASARPPSCPQVSHQTAHPAQHSTASASRCCLAARRMSKRWSRAFPRPRQGQRSVAGAEELARGVVAGLCKLAHPNARQLCEASSVGHRLTDCRLRCTVDSRAAARCSAGPGTLGQYCGFQAIEA